MKKKFNPLSLVSLLVSILGIWAFGGCFVTVYYHPLFIGLTIASLILPPLAKKRRLENEASGKWMEIVAIIIAGFNFSNAALYLLRLPDLFSYLGWIVDSIVYHRIQYHSTTTAAQQNKTPAPPAPPQQSEEPSAKEEPVITVPSDESASIFMEQTASCETVKELLDFWCSTPLAAGIKAKEILELLQRQANFERIYGSDPKEFARIRQQIAAKLAEN